jgi:hypothetical protein
MEEYRLKGQEIRFAIAFFAALESLIVGHIASKPYPGATALFAKGWLNRAENSFPSSVLL